MKAQTPAVLVGGCGGERHKPNMTAAGEEKDSAWTKNIKMVSDNGTCEAKKMKTRLRVKSKRKCRAKEGHDQKTAWRLCGMQRALQNAGGDLCAGR